MHAAHQHSRLIRPGLAPTQRKRPAKRTDLLKHCAVGRVAGKIHITCAIPKSKATPKGSIGIPNPTTRGMHRLNRRAEMPPHQNVPPIPLMHPGKTGSKHFFTQSQGAPPRQRKPLGQLDKCRCIHMVVMIVRQQNHMHRRQLIDRHSRRYQTPRSRHRHW